MVLAVLALAGPCNNTTTGSGSSAPPHLQLSPIHYFFIERYCCLEEAALAISFCCFLYISLRRFSDSGRRKAQAAAWRRITRDLPSVISISEQMSTERPAFWRHDRYCSLSVSMSTETNLSDVKTLWCSRNDWTLEFKDSRNKSCDVSTERRTRSTLRFHWDTFDVM